MANAWENVDMIAAEALMIMSDALVVVPLTSVDKTSDFMQKPNGYKVGDTVRIKTRPDYSVKEFSSTIIIQDIRSSKRNMVIEKHFDISVEIGAKEKVLNMDDLSEEVIKPAAIRIAEEIDTYVASKILQGAGLYSSSALFESAADVAFARQAALLQQLDPASRYLLVDDTIEAKLLGQTWFNQSQTRGGPGVSTLQTGNMGFVMGMNFFSTVNWPAPGAGHTYGNGTGQTNNAAGANNKVGDLILVSDATAGTIEAGDRIRVVGMKRPLIVASQVVATSTNIPLVDPISEIVPDNAVITVIGVGTTYYKRGAIFDNRAMAVAMPLLDKPSDKPSSILSADGFSLRIVQGYDMVSKKETLSIDCLVGATAYDPRRITLLADDI